MMLTNYNPLNLFSNLLHTPKKSIFFKIRYYMVFMLVYAIGVIFIEDKFDLIPKNINLAQFHLLFNFCLSIIIAFRLNLAYSRWWEARGHWGTLVNSCRSITMKFNAYIGFKNDLLLKSYLLAFPTLLKHHLRNQVQEAIEIVDSLDIKHHTGDHLPNLVLQKMISRIYYYRNTNQITFEQFLSLDNLFNNLVDVLGACEKILNTPSPAGFGVFVRFGLLFYMLIFPLGWTEAFGYLIIPIIMVIIYILLGIEILSEELEEPFGTDDNDLPLDSIATNITKNINQLSNEYN